MELKTILKCCSGVHYLNRTKKVYDRERKREK